MVLKIIFFSLLFYLLFTITKQHTSKNLTQVFSQLVSKVIGKKRFERLHLLIKVSGADIRLPFLTVPFLLIVMLIIFLGISSVFFVATENLLLSLGAGILVSSVPIFVLEVIKVINIHRIHKNYHGFITSLIGFFSLTGDVIGSYQNAADYTGEPLRSYVKDAVYKYNHSSISFEQCLDELAERAREREFVKLLQFTKLYQINGGDFLKILNELNDQSQRLERARLTHLSSAYVGAIVIAAMIFLDFLTLAIIFIREQGLAEILGATLTGNILILANFTAIVIAVVTAYKIVRGDA